MHVITKHKEEDDAISRLPCHVQKTPSLNDNLDASDTIINHVIGCTQQWKRAPARANKMCT